jgi:GH35 family endo-1,4-beta-xylanase
MIRFSVFSGDKPASSLDLNGAYLVGSDGVPLRADIEFRKGEIVCKKRTAGPAGLVLLWAVPGVGTILLDTARVPERDKPYLLQVELLRGRLMRIAHKLEEWQQFDPDEGADFTAALDACRDLLIRALQAETPGQSAQVAEEGLAGAVLATEEMTLRRANALYERRRRQAHAFPRRPFGCSIDVNHASEQYRRCLSDACDFVTLPLVWQDLQPSEQSLDFKATDAWVDWLIRNRIPIRGASVVAFTERHVPPWLYVWEHDYETLRDLIHEHVRRVVSRYGSRVAAWDIISGIHADNCLAFNFEQLMELTRMAVSVTKQICPRAPVCIDLVAPWGEYYARNQRTIPPLLYADMAVQSGVNFDGFGLQFCFGSGVEGMYVRDMFQISSLLDRFTSLGKPLHVTAVQVPSEAGSDSGGAAAGKRASTNGGAWRGAWNEQVQSQWLRSFYELALSKPLVESISWRDLSDPADGDRPRGGLLRADLTPKPAFQQLQALRKQATAEIQGTGRAPAPKTA